MIGNARWTIGLERVAGRHSMGGQGISTNNCLNIQYFIEIENVPGNLRIIFIC
jgi:hypothetical protein